MQSHNGPLRVAKNDQCNFPPGEILLISDVLVGAEKHFVPGFLSLLNQFPVFELMRAYVIS